MGYVWLLVILALGVSLFNFFDSRDLSRLHVTAFEQRNKRYGAYNMRRDYGHVMLLILAFLMVACVFAIGAQNDFWMNPEPPKMVKQQISDTTLLSLNTPPEDLEPTLPPTYTIKSEQGSGGKNQSDQDAKKEIKESPQNIKDPENFEPPKNDTKTGNTEPPKQRDLTKAIDPSDPEQYRNAGSDAIAQAKARAEERKRKEEQRKQDAQQKQGNNTKGQNGHEGSQPKNQPMVDFTLNGRTPYENDIYWVRNPGYTCGKGEGGTVVIAIKVNGYGNVIDAVPTGNTTSVDQCIVQRAIEYAKKSRFNASTKTVQEGTITYKFKPQ